MKLWKIRYRVLGIAYTETVEAETKERAEELFRSTHKAYFLQSIKQVKPK
jgi:hypothetical protein